MRKLFASSMLVFALGAIAIGGALAWTGSTSGSSSAVAGTVAVSIDHYNNLGTKLIPDGQYKTVAKGGIKNGGDIAVQVTGGSVSNFTTPSGCGTNHLVGRVVPIDGRFVAANGGSRGNLYNVDILMGLGAEDACKGGTIGYTVTINVKS